MCLGDDGLWKKMLMDGREKARLAREAAEKRARNDDADDSDGVSEIGTAK
jgi:hypothetical protein